MLVAMRKSDRLRIEGRDAERGPEYACPDSRCGRLVYLKKPLLRVHHFAHEPGAKCVVSRGETPEHLRAKDFLLVGARARGLRADTEVPLEILASEEDRRADVLVWSPNGERRIAFEVQHTVLKLKDIMRRTGGYNVGRIPVIWINLIKPKKIANAFNVPGTNLKVVRKFATHAWEWWAHQFSDEARTEKTVRGHLWFLDPKDGKMWRGWFLSHYLYKSGSDYFDSSGQEQSHASYWYASARYNTLVLEGPFDFSHLRIKPHTRHGRTSGAYQYPFGPAAWLLAPSDDDKDGPCRPPIRMHQETLENGFECPPRLQVRRSSVWLYVERE